MFIFSDIYVCIITVLLDYVKGFLQCLTDFLHN